MRFLDLHAHFPMHTRFPPAFTQGPPPIGKEIEYWAANMLLNFQGGKPRVSLSELLAAPPGGIGSVLYNPDDEFFRSAQPLPGAFGNVVAQMENVIKEVQGSVRIAHNAHEVKQYLQSGEKFLFHCLEGALGLGGDATNVERLAASGVAYVTIAHLFYRGVAACENAIPFVADKVFENILNAAQKSHPGLSALGREIVIRLFAKGILVDITHCTELAQEQIFELARQHGNSPVIASHIGVRHTSNHPLNLSDNAIDQIGQSGGVIGIILAPYWLRQSNQFENDFELVFRAVEYACARIGSRDCVAIGSDLDGFIKPVAGCEKYSRMSQFLTAVQKRYPGSKYGDFAEKLCYANAASVLERGWAYSGANMS